jgi:hypothetical protein
MSINERLYTDETLRSAMQLATGKVWRPIAPSGLSSTAKQTQANLVKKAVETATATSTGAAGVPLQVTSVSAVESPSKQQDRTYSEVSVSFTTASDPNFAGVKVWFTDYQGSATPTLIAEGSTSPITFLVETTGETITVHAQAVSPTGLVSSLTLSPTTTVVLDGVVSEPPAPTVSQTLLATAAGYQFQFNYEAGLLADVIQSYNIYRFTSNTPASATIVKNVPQPATNTGKYTYQEVVPVGTNYYYWVTAVNTSGLESSKTDAQSGLVINGATPNLNGNDGVSQTQIGLNLVYNGNFASATTPTGVQSATASAVRVQDLDASSVLQPSANGWTRNFHNAGSGEGVIYQFPTPVSQGLVGPYSLVMQEPNGGTNRNFGAVSDAFSVRENTPYTFSANLNVGYGTGFPTHARWWHRVYWYKVGATDFSEGSADKISISEITSDSSASGIQVSSGTVTSPATAGYARVIFLHWWDGTAPTNWNLVVSNVRCVAPVDPSDVGQILAKGSIPPGFASQIPYSSTTSAITWAWAGLKIYKADGTTSAVTDGSQAVTGLSSNTTYYFYPYVAPAGTLAFVSSTDLTIPSIVGAVPNGTTGYVSTANSLTRPSTYSLEVFFKTTAATIQPLLELNSTQTGAGSNTSCYPQLYCNAVGKAQTYSASGQLVSSPGVGLNNGNWHHLVATYDGTNLRLYIDGVLVSTLATSLVGSYTGFWRIARGTPGGTGDTFASNTTTISRAAVYEGTVLTGTKVNAHYTDAQSSMTTYDTAVAADGATHLWKLVETSGTSAADSIGSDTGTYQGGWTLNQSSAVYGPVGSPAIAWLAPSLLGAQFQSKQSNTPWSAGAITGATTAAGSGGGQSGGSGGGADGCFTENTLVETKRGAVPISRLEVGDEVLTARKTWRRVLQVIPHEYSGLMYGMPQGEYVTPGHRVLQKSKSVWLPASDVFQRVISFEGTVWNLEIETEPDDDPLSTETEHSYKLSSGLVVHNSIAPK